MLINVPFTGFNVINGVDRINATVTHSFNNQRCKVSIISYFFNWGNPTFRTLRVDCPELRQAGLTVPQYGYLGDAIMLMPHNASIYMPINREYVWYVDLVGDKMTFDVVRQESPPNEPDPHSIGGTLVTGYIMLDITPII